MTIRPWLPARRFVGATALTLGLLLVAVASVNPISRWIETTLEPDVDVDRWRPAVADSACTVAALSAPLVSLRCGADPFAVPALLAGGVTRSPDEPMTSSALLGSDSALLSRIRCDLVRVSDTRGTAPASLTLPYARCSVAGQDVSLLLIAAGVLQPPVAGSPAWASLPPTERAAVRLLPPSPRGADQARASRVAIQAWIATLLGLLAAGVGFFYSVLARADRERRTGRQLAALVDLELSALDQALFAEGTRRSGTMGKSWTASGNLVRRVTRVGRATARWAAHYQASACMPLVTDLEKSTDDSLDAVDQALKRLRREYRNIEARI